MYTEVYKTILLKMGRVKEQKVKVSKFHLMSTPVDCIKFHICNVIPRVT